MKILKEKIMKKLLRNISISLLTLLAFITPSCEIGLGEAVDLQAPVVTVISPERSSYIAQTVTVRGTATDNIGVTGLLVKILETEQEYQYNGTEWQVLSGGSWISYSNAQVSGSETEITWSVTIPINGANSGDEFTISAQAFDYYGNEGKSSLDERNVTIDVTEPVVSLISPVVNTKYEEASEINESYTLQNNSVLTSLYNDKILVSGSQKEDAKLDRLYVYIDAETTYEMPSDSSYFVKKEITGNNLRNWETSVENSELPEEYRNGKHLLRLITESYDIAGNVERKIQGWFTYWNEADIPWVAADFGGDSLATKREVYPGSTLQGQAYDDDGIKTISIDVYKANGTKVTDKCQLINLDEEGNPTYYAWSMISLGSTGVFYIKATCTDINGKTSAETIKYMEVTDVNPPSINVISPANNSKLPLTGNGTLNFKGTVSDDDGIASFKLVRIAAGKEETAINYFSSDFSDWTKATESGTVITSGETAGNKVYSISLTDNGTTNGLHNYSYDKSFNLFSNFGINGSTEKLSTQTFILMAIDGSGSSSIEMLSCTGDTQAPTVTLSYISIDDGTTWISLADNPEIHGITNGSKIKFKGTWSDDSDKVNKLILKWNQTYEIELPQNKTGSDWISNTITPPSSFSTAAITAELTDWGGNTGKANAGFTVDNAEPKLVRISSENPDGSYNAGKTITIVMEFNKSITLTGNPSLKLNLNNKTASYVDGNRTSSLHKFTYTVTSGDDISKLDVKDINSTGCTWKDAGGIDCTMTLPTTGAASLAGGRSICIDTTVPTLSSLQCITPSGTYKEGKEIFFKATFSEDVNFSDVSKLRLKLNSGTNVYTSSCTKSGTNSVTFKYAVAAGNNASSLKVDAIDLNGCTITDAAGNSCTPTKTLTTGITIDTTKPATPVISGITDNSRIYEFNGTSFTITGFEDRATKQYSIDGGKSWTTYEEAVSLKNNGTYIVTARQTDVAGNVSDSATSKQVTIDKGYFLTSLKSTKADGTYTTGTAIPIVLTFRNPVNISSGATLTLNAKNSSSNFKTATFTGYENGTTTGTGKKLTFTYTVADGDSCTRLDVTAINGTFKDAYNNDVTSYVDLNQVTTGNKFTENSTIEIVTNAPKVNSVDLSGSTLTITFDETINKNTGNITLTFDESNNSTYKAPAVLTTEQYNAWKSETYNSKKLEDFYTSGTNGSDESGNSDLTEKYVLNYDIETSNTNLIGLLKKCNAHKVEISINSSYVTVSGTQLLINLSDSYKLPVKGAKYEIEFASDLVKNNQNISNAKYENTEGSVTYSGVEKPVIRINKTNETINTTNDTVTQPLTAGVKIDCQTPGIVRNSGLSWTVMSQTNGIHNLDGQQNKGITNPTSKAPLSLKNNNNLSSTNTNIPFNLGSSTDTTNGYIYKITATATKSGVTETAYEFAYRTVYTLTSPSTSKNGGGGTNNMVGTDYPQLWVRGGDWTNGGLSTPGFPISWNSGEFDKVRAMTQKTDDKGNYNNNWYWVTWKINTTAYPQPLRGDLPDNAATKGPSVWSWGMQGPIPAGLDKYALYPGQSLSINGGTDYFYGTISFYNKHCEYRDANDNVIKAKK